MEYQPQPNKEATEHVERQLLVEVYRVSELLILSNQVCVVWIQVSSTELTNKARKCRAFGILGHTECEQQYNFQD